MMTIFDEIYSRNYMAVNQILNRIAEKGELSGAELGKLLSGDVTISRKQLTDEIRLLYRDPQTNTFNAFDQLPAAVKRPLTTLELSWLKSVCEDKRAALFLDENKLQALRDRLADVEPLYRQKDFYCFDEEHSSDDFEDKGYQKLFQTLLSIADNGGSCTVSYGGALYALSDLRLVYSLLGNSFELHGADKTGKLRIIPLSGVTEVSKKTTGSALRAAASKEITVEIMDSVNPNLTRNALERFLISCSNMPKTCSYDERRMCCTITLTCDEYAYPSLLDLIISFGSTVCVISPEETRKEIKKRLLRQKELFANEG